MGSLLDKKIEVPTIDEFIATERKAVDAMIGLVKNTLHTFSFKGKERVSPESDRLYPDAFQTKESARQPEPMTPEAMTEAYWFRPPSVRLAQRTFKLLQENPPPPPPLVGEDADHYFQRTGIRPETPIIEKFEIPLAHTSDFMTITDPVSSAIKNDFWKGGLFSQDSKPLPPPNDALINHANAILNGTPEIHPTEE